MPHWAPQRGDALRRTAVSIGERRRSSAWFHATCLGVVANIANWNRVFEFWTWNGAYRAPQKNQKPATVFGDQNLYVSWSLVPFEGLHPILIFLCHEDHHDFRDYRLECLFWWIWFTLVIWHKQSQTLFATWFWYFKPLTDSLSLSGILHHHCLSEHFDGPRQLRLCIDLVSFTLHS